MHYAILAAGEGSRMGSIAAKPLVMLGGRTMVQRMLEIIGERPDIDSVSIIVNRRRPEIERHLRGLALPYPLRIIPAETPSAAHSLALVADGIPRTGRLIALTVDTVFRPEAFRAYADAFAAMSAHDALMAVTRHIDDEKPMYVEAGTDGRILAFSDFPPREPEFVSAGIYGLTPAVRPAIDLAMSVGVNGLRELQRALLLRGLDLRVFDMGTVLDVDRPHDLDAARRMFL